MGSEPHSVFLLFCRLASAEVREPPLPLITFEEFSTYVPGTLMSTPSRASRGE